MMSLRWAAAGWLILVVTAAGFLGLRATEGLHFRTDLLALLPREEADVVRQKANDAVSKELSKRAVFLIGSKNRETARSAAAQFNIELFESGTTETIDFGFGADQVDQLGKLYFAHRGGLLAERDRLLLAEGKGELIALRALSQVFGPASPTDIGLLRNDPFLLLPAFLANLPFPMSRLVPDKGMMSVEESGVTWFLVNAIIAGEPFALDVQDRFINSVDSSISQLTAKNPDLQVRRLGAVFFAGAGAKTALHEASLFGCLSAAGVVLVILVVFRTAIPLLLNLLSIGVGVMVALALSFLIFRELHVAVLLFGVGLIGIAVDYGMHYSATLFDSRSGSSTVRLGKILPGISLGLITTLIGYATLLLAPFPGLRQIAAFSSIGLVAAFLTVILWGPYLDRRLDLKHGSRMLVHVGFLWDFWRDARWRGARATLLLVLALGGVAGLLRLESDDDVRRLQSLAPALLHQQEEIQRLIGGVTAPQFILVEAATNEAALRRQEELSETLNRLVADKAITGFQMPATFIPSAARQAENRRLVENHLSPLLGSQWSRLGMANRNDTIAESATMTLDHVLSIKALSLLNGLVLAPGLHAVTLQGVASPESLRNELVSEPGIRFIDPAADYSKMLAQYRHRAMLLIMLSGLLMLPALGWRYRIRCFQVVLPPVAAVLLALATIGLAGQSFTFFHAIALILVFSIGMDYAIFCAEDGGGGHPTTHLAIWLAMLTTLLSFGLMAFSQVPAVHSFGLTVLIGISFATLLAPLAARGDTPEAAGR